MSLVKVVARDGKQFTVSKITLERCAYFKTLFTTTVGSDGASSTVFASCDGESFALLVRLLCYGIESVPSDSVPSHLIWMLFHDANYIGFPSKLLQHFVYCDFERKNCVIDVRSQRGDLVFPPDHIFIESAILSVKYRSFGDAFYLKNIIHINVVNFNGVTLQSWPCDGEKFATEHTLQLDFLNGDCPPNKWFGTTIDYEARTGREFLFQLRLCYRYAKSYEEFCTLLVSK